MWRIVLPICEWLLSQWVMKRCRLLDILRNRRPWSAGIVHCQRQKSQHWLLRPASWYLSSVVIPWSFLLWLTDRVDNVLLDPPPFCRYRETTPSHGWVISYLWPLDVPGERVAQLDLAEIAGCRCDNLVELYRLVLPTIRSSHWSMVSHLYQSIYRSSLPWWLLVVSYHFVFPWLSFPSPMRVVWIHRPTNWRNLPQLWLHVCLLLICLGGETYSQLGCLLPSGTWEWYRRDVDVTPISLRGQIASLRVCLSSREVADDLWEPLPVVCTGRDDNARMPRSLLMLLVPFGCNVSRHRLAISWHMRLRVLLRGCPVD